LSNHDETYNKKILNKTGRHVKLNIGGRSRNHFCRRKDTDIEYYECVCVLALVNRYTNHVISVLHYINIIIGDLSGSATFFSLYLKKRHNFGNIY
jgi:hypothetical protein